MADKLNGFDMVLALTESAVNAQLETIFKDGYIDPDKAILPKNVEWTTPDGMAIIKATLGTPTVSFLPNNNNYQNATFILTLLSGTLISYTLDHSFVPPKPVSHSKDIKDWKIGFVVNLKKMAFGSEAQEAAHSGGALSKKAYQKLSEFSEDLFDVSALILDFASANIAAFDPKHTQLNGVTPAEQIPLSNALTIYFKNMKDPFIVAIQASSKNSAATSQAVAPTLVPTGVAYTTFGNQSQPHQGNIGSLSTLNYLTVTDNHPPVPAVPNGIFTTPFVTDNKSSGQLLISRAAFVENFILKKFGQKLGAGFTTTSSRESTSVASRPGVSYHQEGTISDPGSIDTSSSTTITTQASLSANGAEIDISGNILTKAKYSITFIWNGTWVVWKNIHFTGKISIQPSQNSHSLKVEYKGFTFEEAQTIKNQKNTGANVDKILTFGKIDSQITKILKEITSELDDWSESVITSGEAAVPSVFIPPTGDNYSMSPLNFNDSGDLVINVNIETK